MNPSGVAGEGDFVPGEGTAEVVDPAMESLDDVTSSISTKGSPVWGRRAFAAPAMRANQLHITFRLEPFAKRVAVGSSIVEQMFRSLAGDLNLVEQGLDLSDLRVVRSGGQYGEGRAVRVDDIEHLAAFAALGISHAVAPFLALANQASAAASSQSIRPS